MDPKEPRDLGENDTVFFRTASAACAGLVAGSLWGAITSTWQYVPVQERHLGVPLLMRSLRVMGDYGLTYCAVATVYAFTDAVSESVRGKKDIWNGVLGGLAGGSVLGYRARSMRVGVAAGAALAAVSAIVDASGQTVRTPTDREYLPYPVQGSSKD